LALAGVVALTGCKEEDGQAIDRDVVAGQIVTAICGPFIACDCEDTSTLDENDDCDEATFPIVHAAVANAADLALRWHSECLSRFNAYAALLACDSYDEVDPDAVAKAAFDLERCKLVAGRGGRGEPCQVIGGASLALGDTCNHDLACDGTLCRPFPSKRGDWCGGLFSCPAGLRCLDPEADGALTCEVPALENQGCNPHDAAPCGEDLFCDAEKSKCDDLPGRGDPCLGGLCKEGLVCLVDTCQELPDVGAPCPDFACDPEKAVCNPMTLVCEGLPGEDEPCIGACEVGFQCGPTGTCVELPAAICDVVEGVGLCLYQGDGICDEPEGTDLCPEGTDPSDCVGTGTTDPTDPTFGGTFDPTFTSGGTFDPSFTSGGTFDPSFTGGGTTFDPDWTSSGGDTFGTSFGSTTTF
jgi:hypothetical protein